MRVRIHRGSHEIGGSCVEVAAADGSRLVLDLGRPLSAGWDDPVTLPDVPGLSEPDPSLLGVLISHPHLDHYGLVGELQVEVPLYIGEEAARVLEAATFFSQLVARVTAAGYLHDRRPFSLGPFSVTPYLADHSAFDAYSLLVEADGRRLFYTGDIRGHGRKGALFERLLRDGPADVDVLLMEGTHVRSDPVHDDATFETEGELELRFTDLCRNTSGCVAVFGSAQNLDRLVTVFRAARRSGRTLALDLYTATVAAATRGSIPQPGFDGLRVYVPHRQRVRVKESGEFGRVEAIRTDRVFLDEVAADPGRWLFYVPSSTADELLRDGVLTTEGVAVWSMWDGYLDGPSGGHLQSALAGHGVRLEHLHTSGHASVPDLRRLVDALAPGRVVPIHSEAADRFADLFLNVDQQPDGAWWEV
jgi:ribonuclease J